MCEVHRWWCVTQHHVQFIFLELQIYQIVSHTELNLSLKMLDRVWQVYLFEQVIKQECHYKCVVLCWIQGCPVNSYIEFDCDSHCCWPDSNRQYWYYLWGKIKIFSFYMKYLLVSWNKKKSNICLCAVWYLCCNWLGNTTVVSTVNEDKGECAMHSYKKFIWTFTRWLHFISVKTAYKYLMTLCI
jgi:hypothetical protein